MTRGNEVIMNEGLRQNPEPERKMKEQAVVMLKPGYIEHIDKLKGYLEKKGLAIVAEKQVRFDEDTAKAFYPHAQRLMDERLGSEEGKVEMERFIDYISSDDTIALLVKGEDAQHIVYRLRGKIREWFKLKQPNNAIHASSDQEAAEREAAVLGLKRAE